MSLYAQSLIPYDRALFGRITAAAAREGIIEAEVWAQKHFWALSAEPGWESAYEYALQTEVAEPGANPGVITDGMIVAGVKAVIERTQQ